MTRTLLFALSLGLAAPTFAVAAEPGAKVAAKDKKKKGKEAEPEPTPAPPPPDADGDGLPDTTDTCAAEAEDKDGWKDDDGCPDPDNDEDGILDAADQCPGEAENKDGWTDTDGCPEAAAVITPFLVEAELNDGTTLKGKVVRIVAWKGEASEEPAELPLTVDDNKEITTPWANLKGLTAEKFSFTENINCYSDGVEELGDERVKYECTLKMPVLATLVQSTEKGKVRAYDGGGRRYVLSVEITEAKGPSAEALQASRTLEWWFGKVVGSEKSEDETAAMTTIQTRMKEWLKLQPKKATFKPAS